MNTDPPALTDFEFSTEFKDIFKLSESIHAIVPPETPASLLLNVKLNNTASFELFA